MRDQTQEIDAVLAHEQERSAARSEVAGELREDIAEASGGITAAIWEFQLARMRAFVREWEASEQMLNAVGTSMFPLTDLIVTTEDRATIDEMRALARRLADGTGSSASRGTAEHSWRGRLGPGLRRELAERDRRAREAVEDGCLGGVVSDVLAVMRADPERWWTVRDLAERTGRTTGAIYGRSCIDTLLGWGLVEQRRMPTAPGCRHRVREFRAVPGVAQKKAQGASE